MRSWARDVVLTDRGCGGKDAPKLADFVSNSVHVGHMW